jgi:hypothetical protein
MSGSKTAKPVAGVPPRPIDFFISYAGADRKWAEWIGWVLEDEGYRVLIQAWDFLAGSHFVTEMHRAAQSASQTIAVLSTAYLSSAYAEAEWQAAWKDDPLGRVRRLLALRIEDCERPGLLAQLVTVDLFGLDRPTARARLLAAARGERGKPTSEPEYPGSPAEQAPLGTEPSFPGVLPAIWNASPRNRNFTGRDETLAQIRTALTSGESPAVMALHGMGGVGKTQLALEYAHRFAGEYSLVWWIDAEQTTLLAEKIAALSRPLHLPTEGSVVHIATMVLDMLGHRDRWLLVLDNAESPALIRPWLPSGGGGHVLITSQNPVWDAIAVSTDIGVLSRAESVALLTRRVPGFDDMVADELAAEMGDLPLALSQAVGYLSQTQISPAAYLEKFHSRRKQILLTEGDDPFYSGRIDTAWSLSFERLEMQAPATIQLLQLCALFGPEPIPLSLFVNNAELLEKPLNDICADRHPKLDLDAVVGAALQYSLARRRGDTVRLHRLVQAVIAGHLTAERWRILAQTVARLLAAASPGAPQDPASWPRWAEIIPHLLSAPALETDEQDEDLRHGLDNAGWYLFWRGDAATRRQLYEASFRRRVRSLGPDHRDTLASAGGLAFAINELGDHARALELQQDTYDRCRRVLGEDDRETLYAANALGIFLNDLGEHEQAGRLHEETFQRRRRLLGEDHPETLYSANRLAGVLRDLGDNAQARNLFEDTYERCRRILGEDNLETLNLAGRGLAGALDDLGDHDRARQLRRDIYNRCIRVFGPQHPVAVQIARELS